MVAFSSAIGCFECSHRHIHSLCWVEPIASFVGTCLSVPLHVTTNEPPKIINQFVPIPRVSMGEYFVWQISIGNHCLSKSCSSSVIIKRHSRYGQVFRISHLYSVVEHSPCMLDLLVVFRMRCKNLFDYSFGRKMALNDRFWYCCSSSFTGSTFQSCPAISTNIIHQLHGPDAITL